MTIYGYTQNINALGLLVSDEKNFCLQSFLFSHCKAMEANDSQDWVISNPTGMIGRIYVKLHNHCCIVNIKALIHVVSEKNIFLCISHYKTMRPPSVTFMDPRGTFGRVYKGEYFTCYTQTMKTLGLVASEKNIFSHRKSL